MQLQFDGPLTNIIGLTEEQMATINVALTVAAQNSHAPKNRESCNELAKEFIARSEDAEML